ncbi:MAG: D-glycero-alpha-D-manno-heptose-1,7-bisphosphate 7-phosphatase [Chthoniobacterales bacterium]
MHSAAPNERPRAVFLDRDGTIMRDANYCCDPRHVEVFAATPEALRRLKDGGFRIYIITNQSGLGRGYFSEQDYRAVEAEVERQIGAGVIDGSYFCPHVPEDGCACRKPSAELIFQAQREHDLDLGRSFMVGDKQIDAECGRAAGLRTILVQTGQETHAEKTAADWIAHDLQEAADLILRDAI